MLIAAITAIGFCINIYALPEENVSDTLPPYLSAKCAILINAEDGSAYFEKNADMRSGPASTTKIMTALVALGLCEPERILTVPREAVGIEGSSVYLVEGEQLTLYELLCALLLSSANDAAVAIAVCLSGSVDAFVEKMNFHAREMGLKDTHFANPHGLYSEDHYTTARELALITAEALRSKTVSDIVGMKKTTIPHDGTPDKRLLVNHNRMLSSYDGAIGVKTGFTKKTGRTLVSAAERDGLRLIAVTLDAPDDWRDHTLMLDYGFATYERVEFYLPEEFSYELPLSDGNKDTVRLTNTEPLYLTLKKGYGKPSERIDASSRFLIAPTRKGDLFGNLTVTVGEYSVSSPLAVSESTNAKTKPKKGFFERIKSFFSIELQ